MLKNFFLLLNVVVISFGDDGYYYAFGKKVFLSPLNNSSSYQKLTQKRYYKTSKNLIVSVENTIIIKLKKETSLAFILKKYHLTLKQKLTQTLYLVKTSYTSKLFTLTNTIHTDKMIVYAHPNFTRKIINR